MIKMNETNQRQEGALLSYIAIIVNTIVQLLYTPLLIRMLGQSEYGIFSIVSSIIGYFSILDLGFGNAIIIYTSKYRIQKKEEEERKLHGMFFVIFCILGIISFLISIVLLYFIPIIFSNTMNNVEIFKLRITLLILSLNLLITFIFSIYSFIIAAYEKFIFQKTILILTIILKPLLMIPLLFYGFKSIALTIVITIINLFICVLNYLYCKNKLKIKVKFSGFDEKIFKVIFGYSIFIFLSVIVDKINWSVDQIILGAVSGTASVSIYSVASQINNMFINLSTALSGVLLPKISQMVAQKSNNDDLTNEFIKVGRIQYLIVFLMASGLILFGREFFIIWAGKEYLNSYYIAVILVISLCIPLIQNLGISIMQAKNMHKFRSILLIFISIINVIISIPLAKLYDGIGSAIGTSLSLIVGNGIIINIYYYKKVGINVIKFWKIIVKMSIPLLFPIVLIIFIMKLIQLNGILYLILFGGLYTFMYSIFCYMFVLNNYEKNLILKILKKFSFKRV